MADTPLMYGIWIPGRGWLKVNREGMLVPFADTHKEVASEVAHNIGQYAKVRYIDASIAQLERELLEQELRSKKRWHI